MSATAEHFASIDATVAAMRTTWEGEKQVLLDRIAHLEMQLDATKLALKEAVEGRMASDKTTGALHALFAVVRHVLDEAAQRELTQMQSTLGARELQTGIAPGAATLPANSI